MNKNYIIIIIAFFILTSCGKSQEQIELEKAKLELEKTKLELHSKIEKEKKDSLKAEQQKIINFHNQKANVGKKKKITKLQDALQNANKSLSRANRNYDKINEFQFGRSQSTKNQQLANARNEINKIKVYTSNIKNEIAELELTKQFSFQKTPEGVLNYLFVAAKKKDFSKLRYLCDPYAENDGDTNSLCFVGLLLENGKEQFINNFKNGRIMSKPIIRGNKAEIEFAFGQSSNRLEKMSLIKRLDYWYLLEF